jgi:POT family proton-dependent oligopeptide transporter
VTTIDEIEVVHPHPIKHGFWHMPKLFYAVFLIEFWERFAFYGLQSIAILFFIQQFGLGESNAINLFSSFSALIYAFIIIGGFLGDKILGFRRTYLLGILFLLVGYSSFHFIEKAYLIYWAIGVILVGSIFFKTNAGNFVSCCFPPGDPRVDAGFTYFYMAVNMGSFCSMILIPIIARQTSFSFGIGLCGIGMIISLAIYLFFRKQFRANDNAVGKEPNGKPLLIVVTIALGIIGSYLLGLMLHSPLLSNVVFLLFSVVVFAIFYALHKRLKGNEKKGASLTLVFLMQALFFWLMYMQMSTSLTLFAIHHVRTSFFGFSFPPEITQSFNSFYIFLLSPILATFYTKSEKAKKKISIPAKFAFGMLVCALAYLLLAVSCYLHDNDGTIALIWLFLGYGLFSLGELLISAMGLPMVFRLMPRHLGGFAQSIWFVTSAIGQKLGGMAAEVIAVPEEGAVSNLDMLFNYQSLFGVIGIVGLLFSFLLFGFVKKLSKSIERVT